MNRTRKQQLMITKTWSDNYVGNEKAFAVNARSAALPSGTYPARTTTDIWTLY